MPEYRISGESLIAIADRTRAMVGTNQKMTPADIIYWLGRVRYIPQGWASTAFSTCAFGSSANGYLPTVYKGSGMTQFAIEIESSATGALQEV